MNPSTAPDVPQAPHPARLVGVCLVRALAFVAIALALWCVPQGFWHALAQGLTVLGQAIGAVLGPVVRLAMRHWTATVLGGVFVALWLGRWQYRLRAYPASFAQGLLRVAFVCAIMSLLGSVTLGGALKQDLLWQDSAWSDATTALAQAQGKPLASTVEVLNQTTPRWMSASLVSESQRTIQWRVSVSLWACDALIKEVPRGYTLTDAQGAIPSCDRLDNNVLVLTSQPGLL